MIPTEVFVGLGSNIEPRPNLCAALPRLAARFGPLRVSPVYQCEAVGFDGDPFLNLVVGFTTTEPLGEVSAFLRAVERDFGRTRREARFAARTLDLDIILFGDRVGEEAGLRLPRSDILRYGFVLKPLADLVPDAVHPVCGESYRALWDRLRPGPDLTLVAPLDAASTPAFAKGP
jgi:2-amino-4-hydroxy-6-hydroxymethyldihydropteridine diphosphokinase